MYKNVEMHDTLNDEGVALDRSKLSYILITQLPSTQWNWANGGDRKQIPHDIMSLSTHCLNLSDLFLARVFWLEKVNLTNNLSEETELV